MQLLKGCGHIYWDLPRIKNGEFLDPVYHDCPICAAERNSDGKGGELEFVIAMLRKLQKDDGLFVSDPVSGNMPWCDAIASISENVDSVQVSLHPDWWANVTLELTEDLKYCVPPCPDCPEGACTCKGPVLLGFVDQLTRLHADCRFTVWDPVSARLLSWKAIDNIRAQAGFIVVELADNWPQKIDQGLDPEI